MTGIRRIAKKQPEKSSGFMTINEDIIGVIRRAEVDYGSGSQDANVSFPKMQINGKWKDISEFVKDLDQAIEAFAVKHGVAIIKNQE